MIPSCNIHVNVLSYNHNQKKQQAAGQEEKEMTNQEIFDVLAENECKLFYAMCADKGNEELKAAHKAAKQALISFSLATGCCNI